MTKKSISSNGLLFLPRQDLRSLCSKEFQVRKNRNPRYSLRAFARDLKISHSSLSLFLSGSKMPSIKIANQIATKLGCGTIDFGSNSSITAANAQQMTQLDSWIFNALIEMTRLPSFSPCPNEIAERLEISTERAKKAWNLIVQSGLIYKTSAGKWKPVKNRVSTLGKIELRRQQERLQLSVLQKYKDTIGKTPIEKRSAMGLTVACSTQKLNLVREKLYRCLDDCLELLDRDDLSRDQVFYISLNAFPLLKE